MERKNPNANYCKANREAINNVLEYVRRSKGINKALP